MKRISGLLITLTFALGSMNVFADTSKMGVVDLQKIMQTSTEMKTIQSKLEKEFKPRRDVLVEMEASLKKDMEKFKRDSTVMSKSERQKLEKKIVESQQKFERQGQEYQQELSKAHNEAMEAFYSKVRSAIAKVAEKDKYELVLQKDAAPFSAPKLDVTDKVLKQIN
tara:strand:- start:376 stop:876 length:501 start_codon:yes stop_codon:yes gene_type:complete